MKTSVFLFAAALSINAHSATLLYQQGFEDPIEDSPEISWEVPGRPISQAVVTEDAKEGNRSVRGNFNSDIVDPIANIRGYANVHFDIHLRKVPELKDWISNTNQVYVSWWFKLDKCLWKGDSFDNDDPLKLSAKFAYLNMNEDPETSYYLSVQGGERGVGSIGVNSPDWMTLWEEQYRRATIWGTSGDAFGPDGRWHQLSFFINRDKDGRQFIRWWIDGVLMASSHSDREGKVRVRDDYVFDSIGFWHTKQSLINKSEAVDEGNYCNGWQIDDLQVWDDIPVRPQPPHSL